MPNIKALILNKVYSETYPLVASNIPSNIEKIYGASDYLDIYCEDNGIEFVPFGKASSTAYIKIEDGIMTAFGSGSVGGIGDASKYASNVTSLIVEDGITELSDAAFSELTELQNVILPQKMNAIGAAFDSCDALKAIYIFEGSEVETLLSESTLADKLKYVFRINLTEKQLIVGNSFTIEAVICELYRGDKTVIWTSSDDDIVTVKDGAVSVSEVPMSADSFLIFDGYQVRTEGYHGLRSRFKGDICGISALEEMGYKVIEYGTLLASTRKLAANGTELVLSGSSGEYKTLDFASKIEIFKNDTFVGKYKATSENEIVYYCTVTRFTENNYDMNVTIRGYAVLSDENGNEYVVYSDYADKNYRSVNLYQVCINLAAEGSIDTLTCLSYTDVMNFKKSKEPEIGDVEITPDSVWG